MPKIVLLWTDVVVFGLLALLLYYVWQVSRNPIQRARWFKVFSDAPALCSALLLALFMLPTLLDSGHFRLALPASAGAAPGAAIAYDTRTKSLLDLALQPLIDTRESSYSAPLAWQGFIKESATEGANVGRAFPRLKFGGAHLKDPAKDGVGDLLARTALGLGYGLLIAALGVGVVAALQARRLKRSVGETLRLILQDRTELPLRALLLTWAVVSLLAGVALSLAGGYHVLGTDRTGNDVLYQALKSIRTAFVIGALATVATLPFAIVLGVMAGYFKGWVDEVIQYIYTVLSSVPFILLIAACVLMMQVYIDKHADLFETGAERADVRIFLLCVIVGVTGWAGLCRLLRGETLKLRELDYVQAATAFGVSHLRIMARHILPNTMHLVLITTVLSFSDLILFEAVLSYIGIGVDPSMNSYGGMINQARGEIARDPMIWWSFAAAFVFMVSLVLAANLFADGVRDAFDPRARSLRPRLAAK
jgi:peptide/nickel transport system permease protein